MALPFDVHALVGRSFGDLLDQTAPGWSGDLGFTESGPVLVELMITGTVISEEKRQREEAAFRKLAEIRRKLAPVLAELRDRAVELLDINGAPVPLWVWFSGNWTFYRDDRRRERLVAVTEAGQKVAHYTQNFALPAGKEADRKPARRGKRSGGNTKYDDAAAIKLAKTKLKKMTKPSNKRAAEQAIEQLIADGRAIDGASPEAWINRIRLALGKES